MSTEFHSAAPCRGGIAVLTLASILCVVAEKTLDDALTWRVDRGITVGGTHCSCVKQTRFSAPLCVLNHHLTTINDVVTIPNTTREMYHKISLLVMRRLT